MIDLMPWEKCTSEFIREIFVDKEKIESLKEMADARMKLVKQFTVTNVNVSFIIEGYYEVIKELLTAFLLKNGLRSKNHQCLFAYFYKCFPEYEGEVHLITQLCFLRNRLE